ncbi:MAG: cellulose binding domain-containing protein, partial [Microbispora sp.]|nr:cellulose binding domain-containing protein [Microbispora sp.]
TPPTSPSPTPPTSPSPSPSPTPQPGGCSATIRTVNSWPGGFQSEVTVRAGNAAIRGWTVSWSWTGGQAITQLWGGVNTGSGASVSVRNESWNGNLAANGTATFGFVAGGTAATPALTCSAS